MELLPPACHGSAPAPDLRTFDLSKNQHAAKSKGHALFYHTRQAFSYQWRPCLQPKALADSGRLGGRVFGRTLIFPLKVKLPFSSRFAYVLLQFFPPRTPRQLLPKRRRSGAKPLNSAAEAAASTFRRGRFFIMH